MKPLAAGDPIRLGPHRILGVLGEGGMGKVYLGRDDAGRTVAIKVLLPELAHDPHMSRRFVREARAAQAVTSPGVARVLGAWTEGQRPWIATEYLAGPTLDEMVERLGPLDETAVRALGAALARTLQDIHTAGLVHRDLKPANIVLTSAGPRVIDFGIARPEHGLTLTVTGTSPVTPGYGPPEQVLGLRVGPPGDVFALGAVLAYAATGRRAYEGTDVAAVQYQVVHGTPDLSALPPDLHPLLAPCFARDPAHRPPPARIATALAPPKGTERLWRRGPLAADIARHAAEARQLATFPGSDVRTGFGRRRFVVGLAGGGTLALAATGGGAWWLLRGGDDGDRRPTEKEDTPAPQPWDAKRLNAADYRDGQPPTPLWGPVEVYPVGELVLPVRDVVMVAGRQEGLTALGVTDGAVKWSLQNRFHAGCAELSEGLLATVVDNRLTALDSRSGKPRWSAGERIQRVLAADDATVYVSCGQYGDEDRLSAFDLSTRDRRWTVRKPVPSSIAQPAVAVAGGGRLVVYAGEGGDVVALDARTGRTVWRLPRQNRFKGLLPAISGDTVYLGGKTLTARRVADGKEVWSLPAGTAPYGYVGGWSAPVLDGDALYAVDGDRISRRNRHDGRTDWIHPLGHTAYTTPVTVEGGMVWVASSVEGNDIVALHKDTGKPAWTCSGEASEWLTAGAGNRVFLLQSGRLTAMPVI
ncbi:MULTISPECIES: serine/threonine-protein kinase [Streptomyces]|uniref:serine/threonine-protein kinase n=1 Tax=Streptomyces TaxID=1883 RepID=UPI00163D1CA3|nr:MULTISPECIES: serine/threonine-protein kinase [Streptomyces]MBC2879553.1 serine/threonine-protein kinase [Streptomyces sp. TYQ1024]UBI36479.1 serine/threonine-protein kinase [Streptomyces mobaraensis]UKW29070.1 serine/threonine-protein kinase [Streptomyces sp. TYQ1024]